MARHDTPDQAAGITRRRVLALGAAGGGLLLGGTARAAGAAAAGGARVRTTGLALPANAVPGGGRPGAIVRAPAPFDLVGLRGTDLRGAHAELRVRRDGEGWSPWVPLGAGVDHAPDQPQAAPASDPVWAGGAHELQLRARRALRGGRLQLVTAPAAAAVPARGHGATLRANDGGAAVTRQSGAPPIIPRAQWGAAAVPPRAAPSYGAVSVAFVHHTVNANAYAPEDSARIVLAIAKYHRDSNGWNDIGYNFLVDRYGQVFEGRAGGIDKAVIGAQAGGWNSQSTGIATIGTFDAVALPEAAMSVLTQLIAWKLQLHGTPASGSVTLISGGGSENRYPYGQSVLLQRVSGHRDGCKTDCPGNVLYGQLDDLRARVAGAAPSGGVVGPPRVTLVAGAARIAYAGQLALSGQVQQADGAPIPDVPISIQKATSTGGWARVATARTDADGRYGASVVWKRAAPLRAQALVTAGGGGRVRSGAVQVGLSAAVAVTAPQERSRIRAGGSATVTGTVGPPAPVRIRVERQDGKGRWQAAGEVRATVTKNAFAASVPLRRPALYRLTAISGPPAARVRAAPVFVRAVRGGASLTPGR